MKLIEKECYDQLAMFAIGNAKKGWQGRGCGERVYGNIATREEAGIQWPRISLCFHWMSQMQLYTGGFFLFVFGDFCYSI